MHVQTGLGRGGRRKSLLLLQQLAGYTLFEKARKGHSEVVSTITEFPMCMPEASVPILYTTLPNHHTPAR